METIKTFKHKGRTVTIFKRGERDYGYRLDTGTWGVNFQTPAGTEQTARRVIEEMESNAASNDPEDD